MASSVAPAASTAAVPSTEKQDTSPGVVGAAPPASADKSAPPPGPTPTQATEAKPSADSAATTTYEFKLPDGVKVDEGYITGRRELATALKLSPEQAQALVDHDFAAKAQRTAEWQAQLKADPAFSTQRFNETRENGRNAITRLGGAELLQVLDETGLGDFPPFVKFITTLGAEMAEPRAADVSDAAPKGDPLRTMFKNSPGMFKVNK